MKTLTSFSKGFTLIELLVVVTLIAILAVAVLATINPIEQRNRARDTALKQTAADYIAAQERYFSVYGCYTFDDTATPGGGCAAAPTTISNEAPLSVVNSGSGTTNNLVEANEIKLSLVDRLATSAYSGIRITVDAANVMHASFAPLSKTFKDKALCSQTCSTCAGGAGNTYYCLPDVVN